MTVHGPAEVFLVMGGNDLTPDTWELSESVEGIHEEVRPFGSTWDRNLPIGVGKVSLTSAGGLYTDRQKGVIAGLQQKVGVKQLASYGFAGDGYGARVSMLYGPVVSKFERVADLNELTKANPEYVVTGAPYDGRVLHGRTVARTADFNTQTNSLDQSTAPGNRSVAITSSATNDQVTTATAHGLTTGEKVLISGHTSTPTINGVRTVTVVSPTVFTCGVDITVAGAGGSFVKVSSPGGFADLHVTDLTLGGHTGLNVAVVHSADNVTFLPVISFATVTADATTHAQRVTTASLIERYTAITGDFTGAGSPSAIPYVALHRNP